MLLEIRAARVVAVRASGGDDTYDLGAAAHVSNAVAAAFVGVRVADRADGLGASGLGKRKQATMIRLYILDLYIKELKGYKAPPAAKDAHAGAFKQSSTPSQPTPPALPTDLAYELSVYDAAEPAKAAAPKAAGSAEPVGAGAEAFLEQLEADEVEEHHHYM